MENYFIILYTLIVLVVCIRIILNTYTPSKALAYIVLIVAFPIVGIVFYLSVGLNYRKRKLYNKKIKIDEKSFPEIEQRATEFSKKIVEKNKEKIGHFYPLSNFMRKENFSSDNNTVELLKNGEEKFPAVLQSIKEAKSHIHIEYYIYENDRIGNQIADLLLEKVKEGVEVRFIFDDFGSKGIRKSLVKKLKEGGVEIVPFYKINLIQFANRINYRNHRKIIIIDGFTGYVGGINVSDKYINSEENDLYWRDTHLKIDGPAVLNLQHIFLTDWNFCSGQNVVFVEKYFPIEQLHEPFGTNLVQIISSGPDSDYPSIMYTLIQAIVLSKKEIILTTPYFIPEKSFVDALKIAALSGVKIKIIVPGISDSYIVNCASNSYYLDLLEVGIEIYKYQKGFVHAKTMVCDGLVSFVGTANLDNRSFDLNFEVNALVYGDEVGKELLKSFTNDLENSVQVNLQEWKNRPFYILFFERVVHLFSSLM